MRSKQQGGKRKKVKSTKNLWIADLQFFFSFLNFIRERKKKLVKVMGVYWVTDETERKWLKLWRIRQIYLGLIPTTPAGQGKIYTLFWVMEALNICTKNSSLMVKLKILSTSAIVKIRRSHLHKRHQGTKRFVYRSSLKHAIFFVFILKILLKVKTLFSCAFLSMYVHTAKGKNLWVNHDYCSLWCFAIASFRVLENVICR